MKKIFRTNSLLPSRFTIQGIPIYKSNGIVTLIIKIDFNQVRTNRNLNCLEKNYDKKIAKAIIIQMALEKNYHIFQKSKLLKTNEMKAMKN